jgi:ABC-type transport system substrate-binding protein
LPPTKIVEVFAEQSYNFTESPPQWIVEHDPELVTQYYEFNSLIPPFNDIRVRKAFNYAIDKEKILLNTLNNQGAVGSKGITPNVQLFNKYDFNKIQGYEFNPELAKKLFTEAGYPNGKGFPNVRLELNLGGNTHLSVAQEIQHQLNAVLNIWIEFEQVSFNDKIEHSKYGKSEMFRSAWVADYPSPESFLSIFYGGNVPDDSWDNETKSFSKPSYPNTMRFKNKKFDELYLKGIKTTNSKENERFELFAEAENTMMDQAPIIVLWYQENYTLFHSNIRNFHYNSMEHFDFSDVYIKTLTKEEYDSLQNTENAKVK